MRFPARAARAATGLLMRVLGRRLARTWFPVRVTGRSMHPTLHHGDLLAVRSPRAGEPRVGQIVVARRGSIEVVKRVTAIGPGGGLRAGEICLEGDNRGASSGATTGPAPAADVVGVVSACYWPPARWRKLDRD